MTELTPIITKAVETGAAKLLDHYKERYGAVIFIPLGVNSSTATKIAPNIAQSMETSILSVDGENATIHVTEDNVGTVFNAFMDDFFNSLSFIGKTAMKAMGMKMFWSDLLSGLADRKANNPESYNVWKDNLIMVLHSLFDEVIAALQTNGKQVFISNGEKSFTTSKEAVSAMKIFN